MTTAIPGPTALPILGNVLDIDPVDAVACLGRIAQDYGSIYQLTVGGSAKIFISSRDLVDEVSDESRFTKLVAGPLLQLRNVGADSLFTAHHKEPNWEVAHRILMPAFGTMAVRGMFDEMHDLASQLILKWARFGPKESIDVSSDFTRLTLDTIALCSMGARFNSFYHDEMHPFVGSMLEVLADSGKRAVRPPFVNEYVMRGAAKRYDAQIKNMRRIANEIIDERRTNPTNKKDLLNTILHGRDPETGQGMSDESILNNLIIFLIAGHETTSGLLSFLFYYFLTRPDVLEKARAEVDSVVGSGPLKVEHMSKLPYLEACLRETLRLHPTAPVITFQPKPDLDEDYTTIGDGKYRVNKGQGVVALLIEIQRDPAVWGSDANEFRAERMLDENFSKLPKNSWKPFGNGMRGCIGRAFAWQESLVITAMLLQSFDFRLHDPAYKLSIKQTLTIKPDNLHMHVSLREKMSTNDLKRSLHGNDNDTEKRPNAQERSVSDASTLAESAKPVTILFGSDSGVCESMAYSLAKAARRRGFRPSVSTLDSQVGALQPGQLVLMLCSSYHGKPPSNATKMMQWLKTRETDSQALKDVEFAVWGSGNKEYVSTFHRIPKHLDNHFERLGGIRIARTGLGDVTEGDIFDAFQGWQDKCLWPELNSGLLDEIPEEADIKIDTHARPTLLNLDFYEAAVLRNELLTASGQPEKRLLQVRLPPGVPYNAGDHLAVLPLNSSSLVDRVLKWSGIPPDAYVTTSIGISGSLPAGATLSVKDLLAGYVELGKPASRTDMSAIASKAKDEASRDAIDAMTQTLESIPAAKWPSILDILEELPSDTLSFPQYISMLSALQPRRYSIASSPLEDKSAAALIWSVLKSESLTQNKRPFLGVTSNYLAGLSAGDKIHVTVKPALHLFHPPADPASTPVIMVCAGTGLAPFRAFVAERAALAQQGQPLAPAYLFVGCRHPEKDSLIREELEEWSKDGVVQLFYAYSRVEKQSHGCKHVQDRLWRERALVRSQFIEAECMMYVCGGTELGQGVERTIRRIYEDASGEDVNVDSTEWMNGVRSSRFISEIFS